mmetsp:Transcript_81866/g.219856  ORF Transcript_81866/g.219856 Transcript_81866/m.219856 type:complete len:99 (+) Transcript_81866:168-464(+)
MISKKRAKCWNNDLNLFKLPFEKQKSTLTDTGFMNHRLGCRTYLSHELLSYSSGIHKFSTLLRNREGRHTLGEQKCHLPPFPPATCYATSTPTECQTC